MQEGSGALRFQVSLGDILWYFWVFHCKQNNSHLVFYLSRLVGFFWGFFCFFSDTIQMQAYKISSTKEGITALKTKGSLCCLSLKWKATDISQSNKLNDTSPISLHKLPNLEPIFQCVSALRNHKVCLSFPGMCEHPVMLLTHNRKIKILGFIISLLPEKRSLEIKQCTIKPGKLYTFDFCGFWHGQIHDASSLSFQLKPFAPVFGKEKIQGCFWGSIQHP